MTASLLPATPASAGGLKKQPETAALLRVPKRFEKLNLTDEQKSQIHQFMMDARPQLKAIKKKIQTESMGILTDAQKARLAKHPVKLKKLQKN